MSTHECHELLLPYPLHHHRAVNLVVNSQVLKGNPLGDSNVRHNYILVPSGSQKNRPMVFHLSGYFSNGYQSFHDKTLDENFVQKIDRGVADGKFAKCIHVFVDATTFWGGSQFINSFGCGRYQDYILDELYPAVTATFAVEGRNSLVMGGSSGGYGALNLISVANSPFQFAVAVAPDSFFEASLKPDLYKAAPELMKFKSFSEIKKVLAEGELQEKRSFFNLANVIAMAHCYSPASAFGGEYLKFPIDLYSGKLDTDIWQHWLQHDPVHFLPHRTQLLKDKSIYLDVGRYDDFALQFGTRQVAQTLTSMGVRNEYTEFSGNHFGLTPRRLLFLEKLKPQLEAQ